MLDAKSLTIKTYEDNVEEYTRFFFNDTKDEKPYLDAFFKTLKKSSRVLDAGCGPGTFSKIVIDKGFDGYGFDLSKKMIEIAKEKVSAGHFEVMDLIQIKYEESFFQAIISMYALIHISVLKGFYKILDKEGKLFIAVQSGDVEEIRPFGGMGNTFVHFFEPQKLNKFLVDAGFRVMTQSTIDWVDPVEQQLYKIMFVTAEKF